MASAPLPLEASPIVFGTDGWRGVLGVDITVERLLPVAAAAARELASSAPPDLNSREVVIGYDRRFLAPELAEAICSAVRGAGLEPLLSDSPTPTPASSWAVVERQALGALVITASHNPPEWLGLKIKGPFGGSVEGDFTQRVERRLAAGGLSLAEAGETLRFDAFAAYVAGLRAKVDTGALAQGLARLGLRVIVDPMHGSAAGALSALLGEEAVASGVIREIRANRDPLFGGHPPEPLAPYLQELIAAVKASTAAGHPAMGIVIDHLAGARGLPGAVVKTVSGSDLMQLVAEGLGRPVLEKAVGFKYIAAEMLAGEVLVGGEESGGVGFGMHLPERDAPFAALLLIEALVEGGVPLGQRIDALQERCGGAASYDRLDLRLADMAARSRLEQRLAETPPQEVAGLPVQEVITTDGVKLRLGPSHWLMLRFSGTEPLLRLYCEAPTAERVEEVLGWARQLAESV
jgi:phosphomannomutase